MPRTQSEKKEEQEEMERGQMWSVDVIIGVVIFISIITIFYTTLSESGEDVSSLLKSNADTVMVKFSQDPQTKVITQNNVLNSTKLTELSMMEYDDLKRVLGIQGDFCIYVMDENGRIVPINGKTSIGKGEINVSDKPCGSAV